MASMITTDAPATRDNQTGGSKPPGRTRVLLLTCDRPDPRALGGIALHVAALAQNAPPRVALFTAHVAGNELRVESWKPRRLVAILPLTGQNEEGVPGAGAAELTAAIAGTRSEVLHVHSPLMGASAIVEAAQATGVRVATTLHDHSLVCENYTLLEQGERHCDLPRDAARCDRCLQATLGRPPGALQAYRERMRHLASATDVFVAPSRSVLELASRVHPEAAERAVRIEWGGPARRSRPFRSACAGGPLRIAFVGLLSKVKGREQLPTLFESCRHLDVEWHLFGATEGDALSDVKARSHRVVVHGAYRRGQLADRLFRAGCQLAILPSIVAESFSLALSDVLGAGLPVLASNLGALAERVDARALGWTFDPFVPATLERIVSHLCEDRRLVDEAAARVRSAPVRTDVDMTNDHARLWQELAARPATPPSSIPSAEATALFIRGEGAARSRGEQRLEKLVARLRETAFYRDLPLRRLLSEQRRKAFEQTVGSLLARARRR
jgi:glycosyltransferase involved in cell wall biosynthesis